MGNNNTIFKLVIAQMELSKFALLCDKQKLSGNSDKKKQIQEEMNSVTNTVDETNNSVVRFPFPFPLLLSSPFKGMAAERQKSTS